MEDNENSSSGGNPMFTPDQGYSDEFILDSSNPEAYRANIDIIQNIEKGFNDFIAINHFLCECKNMWSSKEIKKICHCGKTAKHYNYSYLRVIDVNKLKIGDWVTIRSKPPIDDPDFKKSEDRYFEGLIMGEINSEMVIRGGNATYHDNQTATVVYGSKVMNIDLLNWEDSYIVSINGEFNLAKKTDIRPVDSMISKLKIVDISLMYVFIRNQIFKGLFDDILYFSIFSDYFKINEKTLYNAIPQDIQRKLFNDLNSKTNMVAKKRINKKLEW